MSILYTEVVWRKSKVINNGPSNGGYMSAVAIASGVKNAVFPDVQQSERTSGLTRYRKVFIHIANDADLALLNPSIFVETYTPGDDRITFFPGSQTDTQSSITGSERQYGAGKLNADIAANATTITVLVEAAAADIFKNGDKIRISDKTSVDDGSGKAEYATINGVPTYVGNVCTITLSSGVSNSYLASNTKVASVYSPGDIQAGYSNFTRTSAAGTYNIASNPIRGDHIGTVQQNWTVTFTSSTAFSCVGDTLGSVGSGNIASDFQPVNTDFSKPYFILPSAGFGGTYQAGDTITFTTTPASVALWYRQTVPAGANSLSGSKFIIAVSGESS